MSVRIQEASRGFVTRGQGAAWSRTAETPFAGLHSVKSGIRWDVERKVNAPSSRTEERPHTRGRDPRPMPLCSNSESPSSACVERKSYSQTILTLRSHREKDMS